MQGDSTRGTAEVRRSNSNKLQSPTRGSLARAAVPRRRAVHSFAGSAARPGPMQGGNKAGPGQRTKTCGPAPLGDGAAARAAAAAAASRTDGLGAP
jgi:hypothetical protein